MIVFSLAALCILYATGVRAAWTRAGRGRAIRLRQVACFVAGVITLVVALLSPIDSLADELFSAHMIQHVLLAIVAPPLLVTGAPAIAMLYALPRRPRVGLVRAIRRRPWIDGARAVLPYPAL
jgi:cytochrome c oxidase assembly factor CtaG